ncbi:MAG TPA: hypothetical protein ENN51_05895 [candidate division WOR-3 bacterium]|uniref:Uncharacterized protein n=1 Tax=candidate division WOR-3 bacterium TaxID=2052148 RepID=A0A7V0T5Y6_UNCW3|nr:hypothetical protein [candidate division WOR-3 bacterium]
MKTITLLICLLALGVPVFAQGGDEAPKVRQELENTDRLIERAEPLVRESGNEEALALLNEAKELQARAWNQHRQRRHQLALYTTNQARLRLRRALELVGVDPDKVAGEIRRTAELLAEAAPVIRRAGVREAEELLRLALGEQEAARRYHEARRYALALRFTRAARNHAREALERVRRQGGRERVASELDRTDALLARARERAGDEDRAREVLERAESLQKQARESLELDRLLPALRLTLAARNLLVRAWEAARGALDADLVEAVVAENDRLIAEWRASVERDGDEEAKSLFRRALELQVRVRARLAAREYGPAYREANQVRRMLNRAIENLHAAPALEERGR